MSATGFRNRWNRLRDEGYRLDGYENYDTAAGARYAGVWRQSSERPDWPQRAAVDGFIAERSRRLRRPRHQRRRLAGRPDRLPARLRRPGRGGRHLDARRLGQPDRLGQQGRRRRARAAHGGQASRPEHGRQGPHPPAVDAGQARLHRRADRHQPQLPGELPGADGDREPRRTTTPPRTPSTAFMGSPTSPAPPARAKYSTHAYTVLGAVLERFEGKPVDAIVRDELTVPFGLTTLRPETLAGSLADRVAALQHRQQRVRRRRHVEQDARRRARLDRARPRALRRRDPRRDAAHPGADHAAVDAGRRLLRLRLAGRHRSPPRRAMAGPSASPAASRARSPTCASTPRPASSWRCSPIAGRAGLAPARWPRRSATRCSPGSS